MNLWSLTRSRRESPARCFPCRPMSHRSKRQAYGHVSRISSCTDFESRTSCATPGESLRIRSDLASFGSTSQVAPLSTTCSPSQAESRHSCRGSQRDLARRHDLDSNGTASLAAGPIPPKADAAVERTVRSLCFKVPIKAGTASLAAGPILPRESAAARRTINLPRPSMLRSGRARQLSPQDRIRQRHTRLNSGRNCPCPPWLQSGRARTFFVLQGFNQGRHGIFRRRTEFAQGKCRCTEWPLTARTVKNSLPDSLISRECRSS